MRPGRCPNARTTDSTHSQNKKSGLVANVTHYASWLRASLACTDSRSALETMKSGQG